MDFAIIPTPAEVATRIDAEIAQQAEASLVAIHEILTATEQRSNIHVDASLLGATPEAQKFIADQLFAKSWSLLTDSKGDGTLVPV